jgi:acetolactate synthase I/II/III large subunit
VEARMSSPDYVKLAEAYGATGFVVNSPDEVDEVIEKAYATPGPVLIDFRVHEKTDVYPWVPAGASNEDMLLDPKKFESSNKGGHQ